MVKQVFFYDYRLIELEKKTRPTCTLISCTFFGGGGVPVDGQIRHIQWPILMDTDRSPLTINNSSINCTLSIKGQ